MDLSSRNAAPVSVEKYGLPVPAANITTRPLSMCLLLDAEYMVPLFD